jgi:ribonuclease Z
LICEPSKFEVTSSPPDSKTGVNPMKFFYQVVTTPTADTPGTAICLHFPDKRYFFGQLAEGTQRACTERGVKLALLSDVFVTGRTEWANTGGLIGMILTLADTVATSNTAIEEEHKKKAIRKAEREATEGKGRAPDSRQHGKAYIDREGETVLQKGTLTVHGPKNLTHTLATARRFVFRKGMPVYLKEYDSENLAKHVPTGTEDPFEKPSWTDSNIKVWALPIKPTPSSQFSAKVRSQSPRKRSLDEFQESESGEYLDQRTKDQMTTQSIVQDMFNSTWKMDTLHETPLDQVKMPAAVFVRNPETKDLEQYKGPFPGDKVPLPDITVLVRKPWPGATVENLPPTSPSKEAICYIVRNHDIRGKFDPKKAQEHNVEKGAKFAALTKGESVQSTDGKTVTPEMVLGQPRIGKGVAIMDVPSPEYVEDMVSRAEWKSPAVTTELQAFIWILGAGVAEHPKFQEFVASMSHCKHTVSGTDQCPNYLAMGSAASSTVRLARLKADSYSAPVHDNVTLPQPGTSNAGSESAIAARQNSPLVPLDPGFILDIEPKFGFNSEEVMSRFDPSKAMDRIPRSVEQRLDVIRKRVAKPDFQKKLQAQRAQWPGADAEIIALGTGSSVPSKYRNVSATLVKVPGYGYYLLDCGENTLGQLKRVFEPEQLREVLQNLRMIWISHLHADHHLGTASVIKAWYEENFKNGVDSAAPETDIKKILQEKRLALVSDDAMISWLEEYSQVEEFGFNKLLTLSAHPDSNGSQLTTQFSHPLPTGRRAQLRFTDRSSPLTPLLKSATGLEDLLTCRVKHCKGALAVSLVFPHGFKISYSGDCRPSEKFVSIGQGSTVLIHEATFQPDMVGSAMAKRHSTSAEAIEVGRRMQARSILLTHFSQRYQKVAFSEKNNGEIPNPRDAAAKEPADADIPFDDPQDEYPAAPLSDDIALPKHKYQTSLYTGPVAGAMDYMRIKVGDFALAQAYAPALEKLVELMERATAQEVERVKKIRLDEENAKKAKNNKKFAKQAAAASAAVVAAVVTEAETEKVKVPSRSVWSASESEDGWETSDAE